MRSPVLEAAAARNAMSLKREAIVFLVPGFPADDGDTTCLPAVQNYVAAYATRHTERAVHVVALQYPFIRGSYRWKRVTVHAVGGRNRRDLGRLLSWRRASRAVRKIVEAETVTLIHSFWLTECALLGHWLSRRHGIPHIASIGGQDALAANPYLRILPLAAMRITAGSEFAAETFRSATGRTVDAVVPLGLDSAALEGIAAPAERDIHLLGVGSLTELKDYATFVDVCGHIARDFPGLCAVIVGEGPERARLERMVRDRGLTSIVRLVGEQARSDVFRMMQRSRILLHPSRYESQGYVFLEAAFAGTQIVCREVGTARDDPAAIRCHSTEMMAAAVRRLLGGPTDGAPRPVPTVDETVRAFDELYRDAGNHRRVAIDRSPLMQAG